MPGYLGTQRPRGFRLLSLSIVELQWYASDRRFKVSFVHIHASVLHLNASLIYIS
jgi:hypothetical protein